MSRTGKLFWDELRKSWLGLLVSLLLLLLVSSVCFVNSYIYKMVIDEAIAKQNIKILIVLVAFLIMVQIFLPFISVLYTRIMSRVTNKFRNTMQMHFFQRTNLLDFDTIELKGIGQLAARIKDDSGQYASFLTSTIFQISSLVFNLLIATTIPHQRIGLSCL